MSEDNYVKPFNYRFSVKDRNALKIEDNKAVVYIRGKKILIEPIDFEICSEVKLSKEEASYKIAGTTGYILSHGEFTDDFVDTKLQNKIDKAIEILQK